ncbi:MAG: PEP-CTERM sorting domain-containing protein [Desulforhopalus sp.]|nr:PEP-CTERM sorting domain-containing protein [Desulforhopalus sp.]
MKKNNLSLLVLVVTILFMQVTSTVCFAMLTSYFVTAAKVGPISTGYFNDAWLNNIYIDPSVTNWIAWHDAPTPTEVGGVEYVGDYNNWLGVDDLLYVTITGPAGESTGLTLMDRNNAYGGYIGIQAVFYGSAADAPNVTRAVGSTWPPPMTIIDEAGLFNAFFDSAGAGLYSFHFQFYNQYSGSSYNPDFYILMDTESAPVPEPTAMLLIGTGLAGLLGLRFRKKKG